MTYLVFDTEFGITKHYNRVGHWQFNPLVAIAFKSSEEKKPVSKWLYQDELKNIEIDEEVIVAHNAKVDLLYLWHLEGLQNAFKRGLKVWDTSLAHYMLSGQKEKFPALRAIAVNNYKRPERAKLMEAYWDKGIDTCDIPKNIVINDVENDVLDTEAIYLQQVEEAKKKGMFNLIEAHNDTLLALIEMEYNGMYIDKNTLQNNKKELELEIIEADKELNQLVEKYWK